MNRDTHVKLATKQRIYDYNLLKDSLIDFFKSQKKDRKEEAKDVNKLKMNQLWARLELNLRLVYF